jgi:hypothetical protein
MGVRVVREEFSYAVIRVMIKFICRRCIRNDIYMICTLDTLMSFYKVRAKIERQMLKTCFKALKNGEISVKTNCEDILTKARKDIEDVTMDLLITNVVENETLTNQWWEKFHPTPEETVSAFINIEKESRIKEKLNKIV